MTVGPGAGADTLNEPIVVIDDDYAMRLSCRKILSKAGFPVEAFEDGARGLEAVSRLKPGLVVVDLKMPGLSGIEVISRVHEVDPQIIIVVITGYATVDTAVEAMKCGAYDFLPKPFSPDELRLIVNRGLERRRLAREAQRGEMERELLKRRFVTFVSHQLQTPLVAVYQYLDVLKRLGDGEDASARRREWLDRCLDRTGGMLALIKDWLTLSRIESGCLARERARIDLSPLLRGIAQTYEQLAAVGAVTVEVRLEDGASVVAGDRNCVSVLFDNLVVNAIKYNRPGGKVFVYAEPDGSGAEAVVSVADTGVGIPEHYRQLLFSEFFRAQDQKIPGTGLGLAISKRIVAEMGGRIEVESRPGAGSTFRVRLPAWREAGDAN